MHIDSGCLCFPICQSCFATPLARYKCQVLFCDAAGLVQVSEHPKCPKVISRVRGLFGPLELESQSSLWHVLKAWRASKHSRQQPSSRGLLKQYFGITVLLTMSLAESSWVLMKVAKLTSLHSTHKNNGGALLLRSGSQGKWWVSLTKNTKVCKNHHLRDPDLLRLRGTARQGGVRDGPNYNHNFPQRICMWCRIEWALDGASDETICVFSLYSTV